MPKDPVHILSELYVLQAQSGSIESLSKLVELWNPTLSKRAYILTNDAEAASEIVQETWIAIAKGLRSLRNPDRFGPWSLRIVQYKSADWIKSRSKHRSSHKQLSAFANQTNPESTDSALAHQIRIAVSSLDPKLRDVVYLYYMDHCTIEQIAISLNIPPGTAKTRLAAARRQLKLLIERNSP